MANNHEISVYFSTNAILALSRTAFNFQIQICARLQTKDSIELESCKQIEN